MTLAYVVVMQGVYMHDAHGPFGNVQAARIAAQQLAMADKDWYHSWDVRALKRTGLGEVLASYQKFHVSQSDAAHAEVAREKNRLAHEQRLAEGRLPKPTPNRASAA